MFVDEDHIPFDKDFLKQKIRSEGGAILDKIDGRLLSMSAILFSKLL
jgi:hypothetical protein